MERRVLLRLLRGDPTHGTCRDRRHRRGNRHRRRPYRAAPAPARLELGVHQHSAGRWPGHRIAVGAHRSAHPLGARHGADLPGRQPAAGQGSQLRSAALLHQRDGAFLLRPAAPRVPDQPDGLPAVRRPDHQGRSADDRRLRAAASGAGRGRQLARAGPSPALVVGRGLRDGASHLHHPADHAGADQSEARQVQRDRQGRHRRPRLLRRRHRQAVLLPVPAEHGRHRLRHRPAVPWRHGTEPDRLPEHGLGDLQPDHHRRRAERGRRTQAAAPHGACRRRAEGLGAPSRQPQAGADDHLRRVHRRPRAAAVAGTGRSGDRGCHRGVTGIAGSATVAARYRAPQRSGAADAGVRHPEHCPGIEPDPVAVRSRRCLDGLARPRCSGQAAEGDADDLPYFPRRLGEVLALGGPAGRECRRQQSQRPRPHR